MKDIADKPVTFGHTKVGPEVSLKDDASLCTLAEGAASYDAARSRTGLKNLCEDYKPALRQTYGTDDFAEVLEAARTSWDRSDPNFEQTVSLLYNCAHIDATAVRGAADTPISIYSIGRLTIDGTSCIGYLLEQRSERLNSRRYDLLSTGTCGGAVDFAAARMAVEGNTLLPGDKMRDRAAYTGAFPKDIMIKGDLKPFMSERVATPPRSAPAEGSAPVLFASSAPSISVPPEGSSPAPAASTPAVLATTDFGTTSESSAKLSQQDLLVNAQAGEVKAMVELGLRALKGQGVTKDFAVAALWFSKAATLGDARAETNLGWLYVAGNGVSKDDQAALNNFRTAAAQEFPGAEDSLGWMYEHGRGVPKDIQTAIEWYRKAAAQGFAMSQANLTRIEAKN